MSMKRFFTLFFLVFAFLGVRVSVAQDLKSDYEAAKKAYYDKDYAQAEEKFLNLVQAIKDNGYLYYDLGNVEFKKGDIGSALLYYEKANRLIPRFYDLRDNMAKANGKKAEQLEDSFSGYILKTFYFWNSYLSLSEFQLLYIGAATVFWSLLSLLVLRRKKLFRTRWVLMTLLFAYLSFGLYLKYDAERPGAHGIILADDVDVRASYLEKDNPLFHLTAGTKVRVIDEQDFAGAEKWLRIALPQGQKGWVLASQVGII